MVKHANVWEIAKKLKPECKVCVGNFPGATTQFIADYISLRFEWNQIVLYFTLAQMIWMQTDHQMKLHKPLLI